MWVVQFFYPGWEMRYYEDLKKPEVKKDDKKGDAKKEETKVDKKEEKKDEKPKVTKSKAYIKISCSLA